MKQNKLNNNVKREMIFNLMNCFCLAQCGQQSYLLPAAALTSWAIKCFKYNIQHFNMIFDGEEEEEAPLAM